MPDLPFSFKEKGLFFLRDKPRFGFQAVGIAPGGPLDRLAVMSGNIMLGNEDFAPSLEIILSPVLVAVEPFCFVLTGSPRTLYIKNGNRKKLIPHGTVAYASAGSILIMKPSEKGFRSYLTWKTVGNEREKEMLRSRRRGDFYSCFTFHDKDRFIRVLPGPETGQLASPLHFLHYPWKISSESNEMGYRLQGPSLKILRQKPMVSDAVSDGTIQLTPTGPIILLYHRQTVGGYPRIFQVISADLDRLAQFGPGEHIHFRLVTMDEAYHINSTRMREIELFRSRFIPSKG